jgi:hypothetical protein
MTALSGCAYFMGESETWVDLYNPQTHELAHCGLPMHGGDPTATELKDRDNCTAAYAAKDFRPLVTADLANLGSPN